MRELAEENTGGTSRVAFAYERTASVDACLTAVAARRPDALAIKVRGMSLSYASLDAKANRWARRLGELGVHKGSRVAILAHRSPETIVAMLAALKCGAAYCPLDPLYPVSTLQFLLQDSGAAVLIGHRSLIEQHESGWQREVICQMLDQLESDASSCSDAYVGGACSGADPAYIMYTSGSTGRPKGVVVPHRGIVRLVRAQNYAHFGETETVLHAAPPAFDASTFEIWAPLLNGGQLAISSEQRPSLASIERDVTDYQVTTLWLTAGLFHLFVDHGLAALKPLRQLLAGGDVLSPTHVRRAMEMLPDCRVINGYGPTENTTFTCCYTVPSAGWGEGGVPIGMPIAHTQVHILDDTMKPVRDGEIGQLCIGGDGVAIGYLNSAELNASRFLADPFCKDFSARMYLSGDLARRRGDGNIEFLGRADRQIKINGRRIELDEIEAVLRADQRIADAVVVAQSLDHDTKPLAAYLKPRTWPAATHLAQDVRAVICEKLPAYMIPHEINIVDTFPLTANGKVDRDQLAKRRREHVGSQIQPENDVERVLCSIWEKILGTAVTSRTATFFELGASSLQVTKAHAHIASQFGTDIPVVKLFELPTIASLAGFLISQSMPDPHRRQADGRASRQRSTLQRLRGSMDRRAR